MVNSSERVESHDIVALVPLSRAVKFADRLEAGVRAGDWRFDRRVAVIGFYRQSGTKDFMGLKKERGQILQPDLDQRLRESKQISLSLLIEKYQDRRFVDHPPSWPYFLQIMWDHLFTRYAADARKDEVGESVTLDVRVDKVTRDLQEYFGFKSSGPRSPEIPRPSWTRRALDYLVNFKMATKPGKDNIW